MPAKTLPDLLDSAARRWPDHTAVENPGSGRIGYRALSELSDRVRDRLARMGVAPGDRVGIALAKSIDAVGAIYGAMKAGASYVPVDPAAPPGRNATILADCRVRVVVGEESTAPALLRGMEREGVRPDLLLLSGTGDGGPLGAALAAAQRKDPAVEGRVVSSKPDDLAYILYTSGSTGRPKGVMLSHRNALSYVAWCGETFQPGTCDRFSSHAPFHFDLSILDLYVPASHGATLVLVSHDVGKDPVRLAGLIEETRLTVWYSAPSILGLIGQYGKLPERDLSSLRLVLFAGEVFPVKHLRSLKRQLPAPRYFNLYGPTETNVCTAYEIPERIPEERTEPYPIGKTCAHLESRLVDDSGREVPTGARGELQISGPSVASGYWNLPEQTAECFLIDPEGRRWYRTGDIAQVDDNGDYIFLGRRDRMVKKRGYRVELGEIEACLYRHPSVSQAAVIALPGDEGIRIKALVCARGERPSIIALKRFCSEHLPLYMVPDLFSFHEALPTTSTDKIDYQALKEL